ncbi:MAG: hypothetical protein ABIB79_05500 [archaeon]
MIKNEVMQERGLEALSKNSGFMFTTTFVPYTSGKIGNYYVHSEAIIKNGLYYARACDDYESLMKAHLDSDTTAISGGESRDWLFSNIMANRFILPYVMIYKNGKVHGNLKGEKVANAADLNNVGSSVRDFWVPTIKKGEGDVKQVFFYVDRMEEGAQVVKDLGLKSYAVIPLDGHAWDYLQKNDIVSSEVYRSLMARMEDREGWARKMLRSEKGIEEFVRLALDPKTRPKVDNIITKGYPDMEQELVGILTDKTNLDMDAWLKGM